MKRIGILGGTFDPPHIGHLIIAEEVRESLGLSEVWFIPTFEPPHKQTARTGADIRLAMLEQAIQENPMFKINTIELERQGKSYTYDTIVSLKKSYPNDEFYFIIGADMVEYLPNWHRINDLIEMITFVGVKRVGYHMESSFPIREISIPGIDISSTEIRRRVASNQSIKYLVPSAVYSYIKERNLYGNE